MQNHPVSVTVRSLHAEPDAGLSEAGTAVTRLELVETLTREAWALAGYAVPAYLRAEAPVVVTRLRPAAAAGRRGPRV